MLHPVDSLAIERFLNGDMGHRRGGRRAMPMFLARREPGHVSGADLLNGPTLTLNQAVAGRDDQGLAQRMRVPRGAGAGLEGHARAADAGRVAGLEEWIDPDGASEPVGRPFARGLRANSLDLHGLLLLSRRRPCLLSI